jgi:hypothetical protein
VKNFIIALFLVLTIPLAALAATQIQLRNDTAANWTSSNPVLAQGERGVESDTGKEKSGNGSTAWNLLSYMGGAVTTVSGTAPIVSSGGTTPAISISAATTSAAGSLGAADKVKIDAVDNVEYYSGTPCTTAQTIDPANGKRQKIVLTNAQTCAISFTQPTGKTALIGIKIVQSTAGSFNGLISGGKWPAATVPTITATTGAVDFISCYLDGTNTYCAAAQDFR